MLKSEINLDQYMNVIKSHARVGYTKLRHPSVYSVDDLIQEGVLVFYRVLNSYKENGPAAFKTLLIRSLRNHYITMMKKSFNQRTGSDIRLSKYPINHPLIKYAENRRTVMSGTPPEDVVDSEDNILVIIGKLNDRERNYIQLVIKHGRKSARRIMHISLFIEQKLRKRIQCKVSTETERPVTVTEGTNRLVQTTSEDIIRYYQKLSRNNGWQGQI